MNNKQLYLLVVDDEESHREAIRRAFEASTLNAAIYTVGTLKEYREYIAAHPPDLALLDLNLPDGRAVEVLTHPSQAASFPILIITALANPKAAVEVMKAGALDYVVKSPEAFAMLPRTVESALREWNLLQEQKKAEEEVLKSEERHRTILLTAMDGYWMTDNQGHLLEVNEAYCQMSGYSAEELRAMQIHDLDANEIYDEVLAHLQITKEKGSSRFESRHRRKNGSIYEVEISAQYRPVDGGRYVGFLRDITERKRAEQALYESEERQRFAMEMSHIGVWELNLIDHSALRSPEHDRIFGYADLRPCWTYEIFLEHVLPEDRAMVDGKFQHAIETQSDWNFECRIRRHDGAERWIWAAGCHRLNATHQAYLIAGIVQDITDRKRDEFELLKMQKIMSVGTLAGGLAHDFNNIMMGLFGYIALTKDELPPGHAGLEHLVNAEKCLTRATRLTKQLLTFSKGGSPVKEDVSLGALVEETARFDLSGSNVQLVYQQADGLWLAKADKGQIQQAISNLTINAREAMPAGGHLYITLENAEFPEEVVPSLPTSLPSGRNIKITVRDEGVGIDSAYLDRIFDPYFTTKTSGHGLGLATNYSIITKHGGHIGVESELGKGTTFTIYVPASEALTLAQNGSSAAGGPSLKPASRILLLDDEEVILKIISRWINNAGCIIETTKNGRQAIDLYQQALKAGNPFDVIILDLTIPGGIGGLEVLKELLVFDPDVKAIVSSGYAEESVLSKFVFYGFRGALAKPYTKRELLEVLGRVLK